VQPVTSGGGDEDTSGGCETKPLHLRVTAKGNFLDGLPVFAGDAKTEAMLQQLLKYFGPDPENGLIVDGTHLYLYIHIHITYVCVYIHIYICVHMYICIYM
jgi:hypothetical protein